MAVRTPASSASSRSQRTERLNLRVSERQRQLIERAASAENKTLTDFVLDNAAARAEKVLADRRWFMLSQERWDRFQELLDTPSSDLTRLQRTMSEPTVFDEA